MKIHPGARKHGIEAGDITQAAGWPHRELRLGFDTRGRPLETVALVFESGDELVIHAMIARKQYWELLP